MLRCMYTEVQLGLESTAIQKPLLWWLLIIPTTHVHLCMTVVRFDVQRTTVDPKKGRLGSSR